MTLDKLIRQVEDYLLPPQNYPAPQRHIDLDEILSALRILSTFPCCADTGLPAKWDDAIYYIHSTHEVLEFPYSDIAMLPEHYGDPLPTIYSTREAAEAARRKAK